MGPPRRIFSRGVLLISAFSRSWIATLVVVSIRMPIMFECRNLHKRFTVGVGGCSASAHVLRGIDLALHAGDCIAIVGPHGAGKSTLLLCVAGLLRPEAGDLRWPGFASRADAAQSIAYYWTTADVRRTNNGHAGIHLVDFAVTPDAELEQWIETLRLRGDAIMFGTRDESVARSLASRVLYLRGGRLNPAARADAVSRVAEPVV